MADSIFGGSEVIKNPVGPIEPIPLQYLNEGLASDEQNTEKAEEKLQQAYNNTFNITPASAGDAEVLNKQAEATRQALSNVDISDLHNPRNAGAINNIISEAANNPAIMAVHQRAYTVQKMKAEKDKAESQSKEYINPGWDEYQDYLKQGLFIQNKQFNNDGYIDPENAKNTAELLKDAYDTKNVYDPRTGSYVPTKIFNPERAQGLLDHYYATTPNAAKARDYNIEKQIKGIDFENGALGNIDEMIDQNNALISHTKAMMKQTNDPSELEQLQNDLLIHQKTQNSLNRVVNMRGQGILGNVLKTYYKDALSQKQDDDMILAHNVLTETKPELDKRTELQLAAQYQRENKRQEQIDKARIDEGTMINPDTGKPFISKAEQAGETAGLKKKYTSGGTGVYIHPHMESFRDAISPNSENRVEGEPKEGVKIPTNVHLIFPNETSDGWHQLNTSSFLDTYMKDKGITNSNTSILNPVLEDNGKPGIYVKDGKMLMHVKQSGADKYIPITAKDIYDAEYTKASFKEKQQLKASEKENISGNYTETPPIKKITISGKQYDGETLDGNDYVVPKTKEEYNALPKGTRYKDSDGSYKIKK